MSATPKDGGPAFPVPATMNPDGTVWYHGKDGMTLRDWFAGKWLSGVAAAWDCDQVEDEIAKRCYRMADAMIAARKEVQP